MTKQEPQPGTQGDACGNVGDPTLTPSQTSGRRVFLVRLGRTLCAAFLAGTAARVLFGKSEGAEYDQPADRWVWQIDSEKCTFCNRCATACIRKPSAVKAVNDQRKCSNCVVCYGHIYNHAAASGEIDRQPKVCPVGAVRRTLFSGGLDGYYLYEVNHEDCTGCGACARECNRHGTKSMFLIIRPDLCLDCAECAIASACPSDAVHRVPLQTVTDFREMADPFATR